MTLSRRMLLTAGGLAAAGLAAAPGRSCSITARRLPLPFSDAACRRSLRALVDLINAAAGLSEAELAARTSRLAVTFDEQVVDAVLPEQRVHPIEEAAVIGAWTLSDGKRDRAPVRIRELNLLKGDAGVALYQFTLRRDAFHAEVREEDVGGGSCGMPEPAHYARQDASYLGLSVNNRLREVSAFDVWLRKL